MSNEKAENFSLLSAEISSENKRKFGGNIFAKPILLYHYHVKRTLPTQNHLVKFNCFQVSLTHPMLALLRPQIIRRR